MKFGLWTYTSPAVLSVPFGHGLRFAHTEFIAGTCFFLLPALLRFYKDDKGHTIVERRLEGYSPRRRNAILFLAVYGALQLISWLPASVPDIAFGPYETQWPKLDRYLVNDICDAPGFTGTRYGLCPGSPGFRMPGRASDLPGQKP